MTVTGTEQRVYGTLTANCQLDLHRFALVYGSATDSPVEATTVYYANNYPYKQCGYTYNGFITSLFIISGTTAIAIAETRICKNDPKRIVIETYGEVAPTVAISLWFNKGSDDEPDWVKLNSTTTSVKMPYATTSFTFKETTSVKKGATLIDCCKKCPSCGCKNCDIASRFKVNTTSFGVNPIKQCCEYVTITQSDSTSTGSSSKSYGINNLGEQSVEFTNIIIEYKLSCDTVNIWVYSKETNVMYSEVYYYDDNGNWNLLIKGFKEDIGVYP